MSEETKTMLIDQTKKFITLYILILGISYLDSIKGGDYIILKSLTVVILWIIALIISCSLLVAITPEILHFLKWILLYPIKRQPYQTNIRLNAIKAKTLAEKRKKEKNEKLLKNLHEAEVNLKEAATLSAEEAYRLGVRDGYDKGIKIGREEGYYIGLETGTIKERNK